MKVSDLLDLARRHYPRGMTPDSPGYDDTEERGRQVDAIRRAAAERPRWRALLDRLRRRLSIEDRSLHISGGTFDSAFSAAAVIPDGQGQTGELGFHVSLLGPYYVVHRLGRPGEEPVATEIAREIEAAYGYEPVPPEIGDVVVPEIALDTRRMGEATLYDCLLSAHWGGRGWMESRGPSPRQSDTETSAGAAAILEEWALGGYEHAWIAMAVLIRGLARGAADLGIDRSAWDNTFAVALWAMEEKRAGRALHEVKREITEQDIELVRRLAAIGSEVLSGAARPPDLQRLAGRCLDRHTMRSLPSWPWRPIIERLPPGAFDTLPITPGAPSDYVVVYEGDTCFAIPRCFHDAWKDLPR